MEWDKEAQLRHSAIYLWPKLLAGGRTAEILRVAEQLQLLGYDGCVASLSADSILEGWIKAGWVEVSPSRAEIRLKDEGEKQLTRWHEEDHSWSSGETVALEQPNPPKNMKRDYNLMRLILCQVRDNAPPPELQNYGEPLITYNSALLVKGDYVDGEVIEDGTGNYATVVLLHLTTKGHDLLEKLEAEHLANSEIKPPMTAKRQYSITVFISHSGKDEKLAEALVELLRNALNIAASEIRCTSVNGYRLPAGARTDEELRREVHESRAFIGLITPSSMASAYVMFELGARWGAGLHLVPLLGAGADASYLRGPLSALNALNCADAAQVHQLIDDLARFPGTSERTAPAAYQVYVDRLVIASKACAVPSPEKPTEPQIDSKIADEQLSEEELMVMKLFTDTPREGLLEERIVEQVKLHRLKVSQLLEHLVKLGLLYQAVRMGMPAYYRLKPKGRDYLLGHGLI